ncbi:MAG: 23S rRNA (guanosine(2251)-2'-O)-methyltransferase RlmB [Erysipelotrichaceae bacterium]
MAQYVYGKNVILGLLEKKKNINLLYVQANRSDKSIEQLAKKQGIKVEVVERKFLDKLVDGNHQGYIGCVDDYKLYQLDELLQAVKDKQYPLLVALDGLEDPHNLGAILRTAACVNVDGIIIEKNRSVSLNGTVAKVSAGAIDLVKVCQVTNLTQSLNELKKKGYWVVGSDCKDAMDYRKVDYKMAMVLVIGSEGKGMHRLVKQNCDILVKLPMESNFESLNASVACSVLLYQIYSCRNPI